MPTSSSGTRSGRRRSAPKNQQSVIDYNVFEGFEVEGLPRFVLSRGRSRRRGGQDGGEARARRVRRPRAATGRSTARCRDGRRWWRRAGSSAAAFRQACSGARLCASTIASFLAWSFAACPADAPQTLGLAGVLGNEEGCELLRTRRFNADLWLVLRPDSLEALGHRLRVRARCSASRTEPRS